MIECISCYEEFEQRKDKPNFLVCESCIPDPKDIEEYRCPNCGWDATSIDQDEDAPVEYSNKRHNMYLEMQYGCGCYDWIETWTCPKCETEFSFENGTC